jgi:hypothetical protein
VLDVAERRPLEVLQEVWRNPRDASDFPDLERARLQELRVVRIGRDRLPGPPVLEDRDPVRLRQAAMRLFPPLLEAVDLLVGQPALRLNDAAGSRVELPK